LFGRGGAARCTASGKTGDFFTATFFLLAKIAGQAEHWTADPIMGRLQN